MASKARAQANLLGADGKIKATQFGNDTITSDMLAPNLELTGDYVKVPVGTTAERPVAPAVGHLRFNTTFGRLEQYVTDGWRAVDTPPTVTTLSYSGGLLGADPAGGETVTITGTNFQDGANVTFGGTAAASVTVNSSTSIIATTPVKIAGDYDVKVTNANGLSATLQNGISFNGLPAFSSPAAGKIGESLAPNTAISTITIVAAEPDSGAISYSITSGALPGTLVLDSDGTIDGTTPDLTSTTTYNFTVTATDDENQTNSRAYNLVVLRKIYAYSIPQSLMFNRGESPNLNRSIASTGSTTTYTFSFWTKLTDFGTARVVFSNKISSAGANSLLIRFTDGDKLDVTNASTSDTNYIQTADPVYRDPSAWYHFVVSVDTTLASGRSKIYANGELIDSDDSIPQNTNLRISDSSYAHTIGEDPRDNVHFGGYLTEVYFIDGQALAPTAFAESYNDVWIPIEYSGTYGTNGFYLPMTNDTSVEAFNTVTYKGTGADQYITGVGFKPDLIWIKDRNNSSSHNIFDSIRVDGNGMPARLYSNLNFAEEPSIYSTESGNVKTIENDGFTLGNGGNTNTSGNNIVAWCWKAGDTTVSNTDGDLTASVRANSTYGFSIITYTGNGSAGTSIGHGLSSTPDFLIIKSRGTTAGWSVNHVSTGMTSGYLQLHATNAFTSAANNVTAVDSSTFTVGSDSWLNGSGVNYVAYAWTEKAGYSKFGSYEGDHTNGVTISCGFEPSMVLIKNIDASSDWEIYDDTRRINGSGSLEANTSDAENLFGGTFAVTFGSTAFTLPAGTQRTSTNETGNTYIYAAFADTRDNAFWRDESGNNNDWQPVNTGAYRITTDTPTE